MYDGLYYEGMEQTTEALEEREFDDTRENAAYEPEVRHDIPNCDPAYVTGEPYDVATRMDFEQGDNPYNASGNCGLVAISNMLTAAGYDVSENDVTKYAIDSGNCDYNPYGPASDNGGTSAEMRREILSHYGISSEIYNASTAQGSLDGIADAIDEGKGVLISVNAGMLWDYDDGSPTYFGMPVSNHCIAVTGCVRDESGEVVGVFIADSGRGYEADACRYLTREEFDDVYTNVYNARANITDYPIR